MTNPCKQCIVRAACQDPCDEALENLKNVVNSLEPGRKARIANSFLIDMCKIIREKPDIDHLVTVNYCDSIGDIECWIHAKEGWVVGISRERSHG